ncbi:MAG: YbfB/YjiJ family MFS transporter, partial [Burkholderiaceae bacterium]
LAGDPAHAWLALGAVSTCVAAATWRALDRVAPAAAHAPSTTQAHGAPATEIDRSSWILVVCYGAFGFGYIVPATFLPAVARAFVADPAVFGWTWPVFGVAAAASTIAVAALTTRAAPRTVATISLLVMAAGVAAPVVRMSIASLLFSAICVGGTFMVMTMAGMQEARRIAAGSGLRSDSGADSAADSGSRLIAGMTAAFALGQLAGPLLARSGPSAVAAMRVPSIVAATVLLVAALVLALDRPRTPASSVEGSH